MTDLIDEVTEDVKEERHHKITRAIIKIFAIVAVVVIIGTGIYTWKERTVEALQYRLSMWLNQGISEAENGKLDDAISHLNQVIEHPHQQYAAIAYLNKAATLIKQNKIDEAQKTLLEMSSQKQFDVSFRDLAIITYLSNQLYNDQIEANNTDEFLNLVSKENSPWFFSALQLKALYDIKHNKLDEAKNSLNLILNSNTANKESRDAAATILAVIP